MAVGMYEPSGGARLPVSVDPSHALSDDRILLGAINVVPNTE